MFIKAQILNHNSKILHLYHEVVNQLKVLIVHLFYLFEKKHTDQDAKNFNDY